MSLASSHAVRAEAPLFADGLGERHIAVDESTGELLQILQLDAALTAVPSFEFAVRERTARLINFRHASYAHVRRVDRLQDGGLAVVSDHIEGTRLSEMLGVGRARGLEFDTGAVLSLIGQIVAAVALLHENARDASHGLISPERLIVTPQARLVVLEHVAGSAIEQLQWGRERLWQQFRVAVPASAGVARFDHRADVNGIGITALSLILGRPLAAAEFPHAVPGLLMQAKERSLLGDERPLPNALRNWLARTLQLDVRRAFPSATEALSAFGETLAGDSACVPAPVALEAFLSRYVAAVLRPATGTASAVPAAYSPRAIHAPPPLPPASASAATGCDGAVPAAGEVPAAPDRHAVPTLAELIPAGDLMQGASPPVTRQSVTYESSSGAMAARPAPQPAPVGHAGEVEDEDRPREVEDEDGGEPTGAVSSWRRLRVKLIASIALALAVTGAALAARLYTGAAPPSGTLVVQSSPAGVEVFVDGVLRGVTPARVSVSAGSHILELRGRGVPRVIPLHVPAGGQVSQYLEFADTPLTGMLVVHSQPAGATVMVGGVPRGVAPVTIEGLEPGDHDIVLQNDRGSSRHVVKVLAGTTASLVAPVIATAAEGPVSGWISVTAPFTLEIHEGGRLIGTTETDRLMLAAGRHELEFVNEALGYRETRAVQVRPGRVLPIGLNLPKGTVSLNADPWAEIWINGRSVGETPIGNLELPIGPYEIVFRHPQLGERRHAVSVTTAAPVRVSVAMQ